jgi:hypothetical protein
VDRPTLLQGGQGRARDPAHSRAGGDPRTIRYAFVPAGAVHYVLAASFPADREADFDDAFGRAFESFQAAAVEPRRRPGRRWRCAWRCSRRRARLRAGPGLWQPPAEGGGRRGGRFEVGRP